MNADRHLITVKVEGTRYRGAYALEQGQLVVEAHGLGYKTIDASVVDYALGEPAAKLAKLAFAELVREKLQTRAPCLELVAQGATTQVTFLGDDL